MTPKKKKKMDKPVNFEPGDVVVSAAKKKGQDFIAGFPARIGDQTVSIKDGILLNIIGFRSFSPGSESYIIEIVTGENASDLIYVSTANTELMELVPTKRRLR